MYTYVVVLGKLNGKKRIMTVCCKQKGKGSTQCRNDRMCRWLCGAWVGRGTCPAYRWACGRPRIGGQHCTLPPFCLSCQPFQPCNEGAQGRFAHLPTTHPPRDIAGPRPPSPSPQVPYLEDPNEGVYLFESSAIVDYLNKVRVRVKTTKRMCACV